MSHSFNRFIQAPDLFNNKASHSLFNELFYKVNITFAVVLIFRKTSHLLMWYCVTISYRNITHPYVSSRKLMVMWPCWYSLSSSSSTGGGRAEGISWISRLLSSVDCIGPSWCCWWSTHAGVKPPSSSGWAVGATATTGDRETPQGNVHTDCDYSCLEKVSLTINL